MADESFEGIGKAPTVIYHLMEQMASNIYLANKRTITKNLIGVHKGVNV